MLSEEYMITIAFFSNILHQLNPVAIERVCILAKPFTEITSVMIMTLPTI
jgi:hypothetical protein